MDLDTSFGILAAPIGPPLFGKCPKCGRRLTFRKVLEEKSPISHTVTTYRCDQCGYEEKFAARHPPHAV